MHEMVVESLNIGLPEKQMFHGKEITSGIVKMPVSRPVYLTKLGFEGDGVADLKNHGGSDKAVCVYSMDRYSRWEKILGFKLPPAAFGENLSISNLLEVTLCIGDIFQVGTATVQISQPRQPCKTLSSRFGRDDLVKLVVDSGLTGFYFRVMEEGIIKKGDTLVLKDKDPNHVSIAFANKVFHHERKNLEGIEAILALSALSLSWRRSFQELKDRCDSQAGLSS